MIIYQCIQVDPKHFKKISHISNMFHFGSHLGFLIWMKNLIKDYPMIVHVQFGFKQFFVF